MGVVDRGGLVWTDAVVTARNNGLHLHRHILFKDRPLRSGPGFRLTKDLSGCKLDLRPAQNRPLVVALRSISDNRPGLPFQRLPGFFMPGPVLRKVSRYLILGPPSIGIRRQSTLKEVRRQKGFTSAPKRSFCNLF